MHPSLLPVWGDLGTKARTALRTLTTHSRAHYTNLSDGEPAGKTLASVIPRCDFFRPAGALERSSKGNEEGGDESAALRVFVRLSELGVFVESSCVLLLLR